MVANRGLEILSQEKTTGKGSEEGKDHPINWLGECPRRFYTFWKKSGRWQKNSLERKNVGTRREIQIYKCKEEFAGRRPVAISKS